jgi:hypothetical protein
MKRLLIPLLVVMSSTALAQTTGAVNPGPAPMQPSVSQPSVNENVPLGGCMPIGLTASGEIVFPIQCRELIERARGKVLEQKPATVEGKSAALEQKPAAAEEKSAAVEAKPAAVEARPAAAEAKPAAAEEKSAAVEAKPTAVEEKSAAVDEKPAAVEEKPAAVEEKPAAAQSEKPPEGAAPDDSRPAIKPGETVPLPMEREPRQRAASATSPNGCQHYRTYNPASGTYRGFDGRTRPCR